MSRRAQTTASAPAGLTPLLSMRKADAAYHAVRRSILLGHFQPGEMLLEQRIAERLNCSQGTVREALLRLEQDGLVSRRGYQGTVVSTAMPAALTIMRACFSGKAAAADAST